MAYTLPRAEIEQEFTQSTVFSDNPLPALIIGPNYKLSRYSVAAEKAATVVEHPSSSELANAYQSGSTVTYEYLQRPVNSTVDQDYVSVFIENAKAEYFPNATLGPGASATVTKVSGYPNRIASASLVFSTANGQSRSAVFANRDVTVGDTVVVTDATSSDVLTTKVKSLIANVTAASIGAVTIDDANTGDDDESSVTTGGTYTGDKDITYKLTIERGGAYYTGSNGATCARVKITSNDVDSSPTVNIEEDTFFDVGTLGVTAKFIAAGVDTVFTAGDIFYIPATAAANAHVRTIELEDNLTEDQQDGGAVLTIQLQLPKAYIEIPQIRSLADGTFNWVPAADGVQINSAIATTDPLIVNGSDLVDLPIESGDLYVERRDLLTTYSTVIGSVDSAASVEEKLGTIHPDNPLAQGVYDAVLNSADVIVYFGSVATNNLSGYNKILELARKTNKYYSLVPLTFDQTIQDAVLAHVESMSTAANAKWRISWICRQMTASSLIYDLKPNSTAWLGTVSDDPNTASTQYTLVTVDGATFITDGVRPGDNLLYNFRLGLLGDIEYDTVAIAAVRSQTTLTVETAFDSAITVGFKVQVERVYSTDEQIANFKEVASGYNNRRVRLLFPDSYVAGSTTKEGFYLCAAAAGLRSGVVPHQGLTNIELLGPTEIPKVVNDFTEDQLNSLAEEGVMIVTQNALGATPYIRHQLTTDYDSGLNFSEDSVTTNVDNISYALQAAIDPYIGKYNVNPGTLLKVRAAIDGVLSSKMVNTFTERAGNQLLGYTITKLAQDPTFKDRVNVEITLQVPGPLNTIKLVLSV